jgi:DNA-binding CsgD family transcriptional regulator
MPLLEPAEYQVLFLTANGHTAKEIGRATGWPEDTVKSLLRSARRKLGAKNTVNAIWIALQKGLL